jgi:pimeloyl-ACP methyl ester carboxylesterase
MRPEIAVLDLQGQYRVYTEFYRAEAATKTIILVNGSLATTASFAQTVRNLHPQFNVVLFDQPYAGKSKAHNANARSLTKEQEGEILVELIDHFAAEQVMSFSWGGACALLALSQRPRTLERAVISSFSPIINVHMNDYLTRGIEYLGACERYKVGDLINETIGKHLPSLFKRFNYKHISTLAEHEYAQMHFNVSEVLQSNLGGALQAASNINVPVLFMNGEWDEYTTPLDARLFAAHIPQTHFVTIQSAGHFLDMEHKAACRDSRQALIDFLSNTPTEKRVRFHPHPAQDQHAFAI